MSILFYGNDGNEFDATLNKIRRSGATRDDVALLLKTTIRLGGNVKEIVEKFVHAIKLLGTSPKSIHENFILYRKLLDIKSKKDLSEVMNVLVNQNISKREIVALVLSKEKYYRWWKEIADPEGDLFSERITDDYDANNPQTPYMILPLFYDEDSSADRSWGQTIGVYGFYENATVYGYFSDTWNETHDFFGDFDITPDGRIFSMGYRKLKMYGKIPVYLWNPDDFYFHKESLEEKIFDDEIYSIREKISAVEEYAYYGELVSDSDLNDLEGALANITDRDLLYEFEDSIKKIQYAKEHHLRGNEIEEEFSYDN